jgi:4-amino-4-deoxy-L-arabinose transferase-like glycosyltransferase
LSTAHYRLLLLVGGALLFIPFLGYAPLFDWDEANFAESAREMLISGDYTRVTINFQPFWEKPPLFIWMQALCMQMFGIGEFAARLPNAIFGIITLLTVFEMGRNLRSDRFGFLWALSMAGSFLPHVYFKSGIIDPVFNFFIFCSISAIADTVREGNQTKSLKSPLLAGIFMGLAVLTKGPVGVLIPLLCVVFFWIFNRFKPLTGIKQLGVAALAAFCVSAIWFVPETLKNGFWFLQEFIVYQIRLFSTPDAGHAQPFFYHFVIILLGCFPASPLAMRILFRYPQARLNNPDFLLWMKVLFWVVLILFTIVTTKIVHYSSLCYLPITAMAALSLEEFLRGRQNWSMVQVILFVLNGSVLGIAMLALPIIATNPEWVKPYLRDAFAQLALQADVSWTWLDFIPGIIWLVGLLVAAGFLLNQNRKAAIAWIFVPVVLATSLFLIRFPKRIAAYSQGAAIEFYSFFKNKDVYLETFYFKSYAVYFYAKRKPLNAREMANRLNKEGEYHVDVLRQWYLGGNIDKPFYFVIKIDRKEEFMGIPGVKKLYEKNGFVFMLREVPKS